MEELHNSHYKYRRWPLFLPSFTVFALIYYFFLSEGVLADSLVWTIFFLTFPLLAIFHLKIVKIQTYKPLGLDLLFGWVIGTVLIFLLMLTYIEGMEWFGALFTFFIYFIYFLLMQFVCWVLFRVTSKKHKNHEGQSPRAL